jgi:biotin carboxylase
MVKPVDLTGGKGVRLCENLKEALNAYEAAMSVTRENFVIVEEYVKGSSHGASVLLKNQKVVFGFVDNEQYYRNPYLVSGACFPSDVGDVAKRKLFSDIECIAEKLQLVDGIFHVQFILREDGTPVMIDPCRRAPGDLYIKLVQYATGVDYPEEILKAEYGEPLQEKYSVSLRNVARQCVMTDKNGSFEDIYYATELGDKIFSKLIWAKKGELIQNFMTYKAGILFLESEEKDALYQLVRDFHDLVKIITG